MLSACTDPTVGTPGAADLAAARIVNGLSWTLEPDLANTSLGNALAAAGDVNGDGFPDFIVGASNLDGPVYDDVGAAYVLHGTKNGPGAVVNWGVSGTVASTQFGASVSGAGDVNGDGYDDVIVGAPGIAEAYVYLGSSSGLQVDPLWTHHSSQATSRAGSAVVGGYFNDDEYADVAVGSVHWTEAHSQEGKVEVFFGSADGPSAQADWVVFGGQQLAFLGHALEFVQLNEDQNDDLVVATPFWDGTYPDTGRVEIYYGGTPPAQSPGTSLLGQYQSERFGYSVAGGHLTGDQNAELVVGAPNYGIQDDEQQGRTVVYGGSASGIDANTVVWSDNDPTEIGSRFGHSVAIVGDTNGDGFGDLLIGSPGAGGGTGHAELYLGGDSVPDPTPTWTAEGEGSGAAMGSAVAGPGDVDGDGLTDLLFSAPNHSHPQAAEGKAYLYYGSTSTPSAKEGFEHVSGQDSAFLGRKVAAVGDVNGDGFGDVIAGAFGYDGPDHNEGIAYLYLGSATGMQAVPAWSFENGQSDTSLGFAAAAAGDVNGDGFADVLVGAPEWDESLNEGKAYLFYGGLGGLAQVPDWSFVGDQEEMKLAYSVSTAGDVDGDGYADFLVGAKNYSDAYTEQGLAHLFLGSETGPADTPDMTFLGSVTGAHFGHALGTAGDVDGDGYSDFAISAPAFNDGSSSLGGRVYVWHGDATGPAQDPSWTLSTEAEDAQLGWEVGHAGDVNGDGFSDVIVSTPQESNGQNNEGFASVFHGSDSGLSQTPDWYIEADQSEAYLGAVASAGDTNGDGYADVVIGARGITDTLTSQGRVTVYLGSPSGLQHTANWTKYGTSDGAFMGRSVSGGDVDGDGFSDIIIGSSKHTENEPDEGSVTVFHGAASNLSQASEWSFESDQTASYLGQLAGAGDVNGDGFDDLVIGAPGFTDGQSSEGKVFLFHGNSSGLPISSSDQIQLNTANANLGASVDGAGNVNGDGFEDVLIGAPGDPGATSAEGRAVLYFGTSTILGKWPDWEVASGQTGALMGQDVAGLGDVNGDGFSDIAVGLSQWTGVVNNSGAVWVYHGAADGPALLPDWSAEGEGDGEELFNVAGPGDVNGDGYDDLLMGAGSATNGEAYLVLGAADGFRDDGSWDWKTTIDTSYANFGSAISGAGDINNDGFADIIVGARSFTHGETDEGRAHVFTGGPSGPSDTLWWFAEGNLADRGFGTAVGGGGDINGDGYDDVLVGSPGYANPDANEGGLNLYQGGNQLSLLWSVESNHAAAHLGVTADIIGDVNGDGFADIASGATRYTSTETDEGIVHLWLGNHGETDYASALVPKLKAFNPNNGERIANRGLSDAADGFEARWVASSAAGRVDGRLEVEVKPAGQPFDGEETSVAQQWNDLGIDSELLLNVDGLLPQTRYRWRARMRYRPSQAPQFHSSRWFDGGWVRTHPIPIFSSNLPSEVPYGSEWTYSASATDPTGANITYSAGSDDTCGGTIDANGSTYTADADVTCVISVTACAGAYCATQTGTVIVLPPADTGHTGTLTHTGDTFADADTDVDTDADTDTDTDTDADTDADSDSGSDSAQKPHTGDSADTDADTDSDTDSDTDTDTDADTDTDTDTDTDADTDTDTDTDTDDAIESTAPDQRHRLCGQGWVDPKSAAGFLVLPLFGWHRRRT
jgi:hypothetical protein